jgi:hypothetical protein
VTDARQARGKRTNVVVAAWLAAHGWPRADPTVGAETGRDVHNIYGHCLEVKARKNFDPLGWWKQAKDNAEPGERSCVIIRCNGQGEHAEQYFVLRRLEDDELNRSGVVGCGEGCTGYGCSFCEATEEQWATKLSSSRTACWLSTAAAWMPGSAGT